MTNHTITLYPTLAQRLTARGWTLTSALYPGYDVIAYTKRRGDYVHIVNVNYLTNRVTFSRYERLSK